MPTTVNININSAQQVLLARHLEHGGQAQQFLCNEIYKMSDLYTPLDSSTLKSNVSLASDGSSITYNSPYARRMWEGKVMAGTPLEATDKEIKFQGSPMRGAFWTTRMWADRGDEILRSTAAFVGGRVE